MATHSSVLAWRIPGMGETGGLPSMGSHRVGHPSPLHCYAIAIPALFCYLYCLFSSNSWLLIFVCHQIVCVSYNLQIPGFCPFLEKKILFSMQVFLFNERILIVLSMISARDSTSTWVNFLFLFSLPALGRCTCL